MPRFSRIAPLCMVLALPLGCGRDLPGLFSTKAETLRVSPARFGLYLGQDFQYDVIRDRADASTSVLTAPDLTLGVDNPALVQLGEPGRARAIAPGSTVLQAQLGGLRAEASVTIRDATLASLEVSPSSLMLARGQTASLTVLGRLTDASTVDLTLAASGTIYRSANDAIATVGPNGLVTAVANGGVTIEIIHAGITVAVRVQVGDDQSIVGLALRPERTSLEFGAVLQLEVIGITAGGAEVDLRPSIASLGITFSASDPRVATVSEQAVVTAGQLAGVSLVNATYGELQATSEIRTRPPAILLVGIEARPAFLTTAIQSSAQLTIVGFYSDGSIADLTLAAAGTTYVSEDDRMLTVTADGLVRSGTTEGTALIFVRNGGFETVVFVEIVAESRLDFIQVTPNPVTMRMDTPVQLMVTAFYSDGRIEDVTRLGATFRASGAVTVTGGGLVRATRTGTGQVDATFMGMVVSVPVTVTDARVVGLFIDPPFISVIEGGIAFGITIFAELSDGSIVAVNGDPGLVVRVENPRIAGWIGNGVEGFQAGFTALVASYQGFEARADIEVTGGGGQIVAILVLAPAQMMVGATDNFAVIGFFSDGTGVELTGDPGLSVVTSGPQVIIMGSTILAQSAGRVTITATYQGFQDTADVLVQTMPDPVVSIAFVPSSLTLAVGGSAVVRLEATLASGQTIDITWDLSVNYTGSGPIVGFPDPGGIRIEAAGLGMASVQAEYQGHVANLTITITNGMVVVIGLELRAPPTVPLNGTAPYQVIAIYSDGSTADVTNDPGVALSVSPPGIIGAANGAITGLAAGQATLTARFGGQMASRTIQVVGLPPPPPFIASIVPNAIAVGSMTTQVTLNGSGFSAGDTVFVNGAPVMTGFGGPTNLQAQIPSSLLTMPRTLSVQVIGPNGASNTVTITVGTPPNVTSFFPTSVVAGSSVEVTAVGSGLSGLSFSGAGLTYVLLSAAPDGSSVRFRVTAPANTAAGPRTITLTNPFGSTNIVMQVVGATNQMDLVVNAGQTVMLGGTNVYANITVQTGGRIIASGVEPLVLISTGNITVRGTIDANGRAGDQGFTNPAPGGAAGSGGGGGGGGGDGNGNPPAVGGAGSPAGGAAAVGSGAGTRGGNGGGTGGGVGASGGCGQGGGGGGFAGAGGRGGGDAGPGTGGVGGAAGSSGSTFGAGTGGGGGSTCGSNSGGGGGGGGGMIVLQAAFAGTLLVDGALSADGGNGGDGFNGTGGGGGGSGGRIELRAPSGSIVVNDTVHVRGGNGGASDFGDTGGGGGGGIIRIDASPAGSVNVGLGLLDAAGGNFGASLGAGNAGRAGGAGQITVLP